jgi:hypothetical protein
MGISSTSSGQQELYMPAPGGAAVLATQQPAAPIGAASGACRGAPVPEVRFPCGGAPAQRKARPFLHDVRSRGGRARGGARPEDP